MVSTTACGHSDCRRSIASTRGSRDLPSLAVNHGAPYFDVHSAAVSSLAESFRAQVLPRMQQRMEQMQAAGAAGAAGVAPSAVRDWCALEIRRLSGHIQLQLCDLHAARQRFLGALQLSTKKESAIEHPTAALEAWLPVPLKRGADMSLEESPAGGGKRIKPMREAKTPLMSTLARHHARSIRQIWRRTCGRPRSTFSGLRLRGRGWR